MNHDSKNKELGSDTEPRFSLRNGPSAQSLALFCVGCLLFVGLMFLAWHYAEKRREFREEIAVLEQELSSLQELQKRLVDAERNAASDRQVITDCLRMCRSASDIPDLNCNRVLASANGFQDLCFYVPEGQHSFVIDARWKANGKPDTDTPENRKTWRIPLLPNSGYWMKIHTDRDEVPIEWNLTSNHPEFQTQRESLPIDSFSGGGREQRSNKVVQYPNQLEEVYAAIKKITNLPAPGIDVFNLTLTGDSIIAVDEHNLEDHATGNKKRVPIEIEFKIQIESEGPLVVAASDANVFHILQSREQLKYAGQGKYAIETK